MKPVIIILLLILTLPTVLSAQVEYSVDNATWKNVTSLDTSAGEGIQLNLQKDAWYHFRGKNDTFDWAYLYVQTKGSEEAAAYYIYITVFAIAVLLLIIGYQVEDNVFQMMAGMLFIVTSVNILLNSFPNLTNTYLINGLVAVLAGIGMYYVLVPTIRQWQEWGW